MADFCKAVKRVKATYDNMHFSLAPPSVFRATGRRTANKKRRECSVWSMGFCESERVKGMVVRPRNALLLAAGCWLLLIGRTSSLEREKATGRTANCELRIANGVEDKTEGRKRNELGGK